MFAILKARPAGIEPASLPARLGERSCRESLCMCRLSVMSGKCVRGSRLAAKTPPLSPIGGVVVVSKETSVRGGQRKPLLNVLSAVGEHKGHAIQRRGAALTGAPRFFFYFEV